MVKNLASATSQAATLTIVPLPDPMTPYEAALQAANPDWYWRFNEAFGSVYAYDYWGGIIATNENVTTGADGPRPPDFPGFEDLNLANTYDGFTSDTSSGLSLLNDAAEFSILGWIKSPSTGYQAERTGLFGQNDVAEFGFHGADA